MDIWSQDKLVLFVLFVIPGFIGMKFYELLCPGTYKDSSARVIDAIAYSCINYAILAPFLWGWKSGSVCPFLDYLGALFVLVIAPLLWAYLWKRLRETKVFQKNAPHPIEKPWDFFFKQRKPHWVKITLNNGTIIGGKFYDRSFASSAPAEEQLYLEETWLLDEKGKFLRKINDTTGVLVLSKNISHVEFRELKE
ncbi:DUF6338 family protein [Pseudoxanthomonas mexicana]|uniref:DUF6338 family protein n=1 Tax=Pseudoxanthomonas mexicana TaxID=128785 RepID=UPI0022F3A4EA|nr:DUF6338 family protein [Pseudoxanthomonas mexicana]WBX92546.1 DUF6338 family protein [Pseudoxanthomonas mexicana]